MQPFYNLLINLTNSHTNPNCQCSATCDPLFQYIDLVAISTPELAFGAFLKTFNFTDMVNMSNSFETYNKFKSLPLYNYTLQFNLYKGNRTDENKLTVYDYRMEVKDSQGMISKNYSLFEFTNMLSDFMYVPPFTESEIKDFCIKNN